jgi:acetyl-CoA carboxylase carboxyl transferase subunit alpha
MAEVLKITSEEALRMGVIDEIIPEPLGGAHRNLDLTARSLKTALIKHLNDLEKLTIPKLLDKRYKKFRAMGEFEDLTVKQALDAVGG